MINAHESLRNAVSIESLTTELRDLVNDAAVSSGVVGAQVSVILDGTQVDLIHGSANLELNTPMRADTVIQVGSVCKVFNAALVMTLVEEGKLDLDRPVIEYIPELRIADEHAQRTITLRQLLSMSSGLDNGPYNDHGMNADALGKFVASLRDVPQMFPPGQGFGYSNAGTSIAGYVAERVTGTRWDVLMQTRIFDPAGLKHAVTLAEELPFHHVSVGYSRAQQGQPAKIIRPWYVTHAQGPAGSTLGMSAHDLAAFGQLFVNHGMAANGKRVLSEASIKMMLTPVTDVPVSASFVMLGQKWGLGPSMDRWGDTVVWGHGGGNRSGRSRLAWFPEKQGVLAVTVNTPDGDDAFTTRILGDLSPIVFGAGARMPRVPAHAVRLENRQRFLGQYERYGSRYEVSEEAGRLRLKEVSLGSGKNQEELGVVLDSALVPLGGDRFLIEGPGRAPKPVQPSSAVVGFFGNDGRGRASNLVAPFLPARRMK